MILRKGRGYMVRFCDGEVKCVEYTSLTADGLLGYFSQGHKNEIVCVYDNFYNRGGRYVGAITYHSVQHAAGIEEAIKKEYIVWNNDMWKNAREYFKHASLIAEIGAILPVLDEAGRLICFAYEDMEAKREIRMLRELQEAVNVLQFTDIYPENKYVRIYDFNELAYLFAQYLEQLGIKVETIGEGWKGFFRTTNAVPASDCFTIYAEGVGEKKQSYKEELMKSVSVEFECIDSIYETNIKNGRIADACGDIVWFMERIRNEKEIVIVGTGIYSLNAYEILRANDIEIFCFLSEDLSERKYKMFDKKVLSEEEVKNCTKRPVFLECNDENSAWGFGETDRYDYEGYRRNDQYFMLKDYTDIPIGYLKNLLKDRNAVLIGNFNLCCNINRILEDVWNCHVTYWDLLGENPLHKEDIEVTDDRYIAEDAVCLLVEPQYLYMPRKKELYLKQLRNSKIQNFTDYFSYNEVLIFVQKQDAEKYTIPCLTPDKIVIDISGHMSGNAFFMSLLQGHSEILMMELDVWKIISNLFLICIQLAEERSEDVLPCFWEIYAMVATDGNQTLLQHRKIFDEKFKELLSYKKSFTSQELFVMIHIAYAKIWGTDIVDVSNMMLYFEQHAALGIERINYEQWLCDQKVKGFSILIARNSYIRVGSYFRHLESYGRFSYPNMGNLWKNMMYIDKDREVPDHWERFEVKFEDLKTKPMETLGHICDILSISWNECLLKTTEHGEMEKYFSGNEMVTGFDLKPVYNLYEEYFSDFDRLRINMIFSELQKRFDYPYVSCQNFSRRQLQEMFLVKFRFECRLTYDSDFWKKQYRKDMMNIINQYLQKSRKDEMLKQ